jgi:2-hydroxychromene-2-carboxylate isomerase
MELLFYYDVVCPFAYLASTRVEALAERTGARLVWRPVLLGGIFRDIGAPDRPAGGPPPPRARLGWLDLVRYAALYGVPLALPAGHPRRSVEAMRLCHVVDGEARARLSRALYHAYFAEGRDFSDRAVLAEVCGAAGVAPESVGRIDEPEVKDALHRATDEAVAHGAFGVPTFVVDGKHLFFGQDRMHLVEKALTGWQVPA